MRSSLPFCAVMLLAVSCQQPHPTATWAGSHRDERVELMQAFPQLSPEEALGAYPDVDEKLVRASWPSTLEQAVSSLIAEMSNADKQMVRDKKKEELILFHQGWGTGIRNDFGLWRGNTNLLADCHATDPDGASMVIIEAVWQRLQEN